MFRICNLGLIQNIWNNMNKIILAILLISAAGSCHAVPRDWDEQERKLYHSYIALSIIDTHQTFKMIQCQRRPHCPIVEKNPLIGETPTKGKVMAVKLVGNALIYKLLDRDDVDRKKALRWLNGVQGFVVVHNGIYWERKF